MTEKDIYFNYMEMFSFNVDLYRTVKSNLAYSRALCFLYCAQTLRIALKLNYLSNKINNRKL